MYRRYHWVVASEMDPGVDHNEATGVAEMEGA